MKKLLIVIAILVCTFLMGAAITAKAYSWKHIIGGGLYGTIGTALQVESDGTLYLTD